MNGTTHAQTRTCARVACAPSGRAPVIMPKTHKCVNAINITVNVQQRNTIDTMFFSIINLSHKSMYFLIL